MTGGDRRPERRRPRASTAAARRGRRPWGRPAAAAALALLGACADADAPSAGAPSDSAGYTMAPLGDTDVWVADLVERGDSLALMEPRNVTRRAGYDNQPAFLPNERGLLYTAVDEAGQADTWHWDPASDSVRPVTRTAPESEYSPTPLPGGDGFSAIRVEADSTQRLWRFAMDGSGARPVLEDVAPVGYHAWFDAGRLALFVLGEPPTLRIADAATGAARVVAEDIGRSLNPIPGRQRAVSWIQREGEGASRVMAWDLDADRAEPLTPAPDGGDYHAWTPAGTLLMASGSRLLAWREGWEGWRTVADLEGRGLLLSRLAVSPDGRRLAFVAERAPGA
ncbi:MAG: hypothetical protein KY453_09405 [Gemmatimonadetes bacterium]|nr:hypothetical protein [Gemmatimonadota bacterium]